MKQHKHKLRKIGRYEAIDWSKLVGKQISTHWSSEPQLVCKNGTLEKKLLALSRDEDRFVECGYFIAHCQDGIFKQLFTSFSPAYICPKDTGRALYRLYKKIGRKWDKVITLEFMHTHDKDLGYDPLSQADIEAADGLAEQLYSRGVKNIIVTAASKNGYSFKYSPSFSAFNSKYRKTKEK